MFSSVFHGSVSQHPYEVALLSRSRASHFFRFSFWTCQEVPWLSSCRFCINLFSGFLSLLLSVCSPSSFIFSTRYGWYREKQLKMSSVSSLVCPMELQFALSTQPHHAHITPRPFPAAAPLVRYVQSSVNDHDNVICGCLWRVGVSVVDSAGSCADRGGLPCAGKEPLVALISAGTGGLHSHSLCSREWTKHDNCSRHRKSEKYEEQNSSAQKQPPWVYTFYFRVSR